MSNAFSVPHYRPSVRIGNWFEDICLEEDEIKSFLEKQQKSELLIEKTRLLFHNFHAEVELDSSADHIRFGSVIQILSCMKTCDPTISMSALSVIINEQVVRNNCQRINDKCELTVAPAVNSCARNSFKIVSCDNEERTGEVLKYGQHFSIQCVDAEEQPLLLISVQKNADLTTIVQPTFESRKRGEINRPVALCLKRNTGPGKDIPSAYTKWKCCYHDPDMRFETEGCPIMSNTTLVIVHSVTNRKLAAENIIIQTLFGPEYLVSVQNYNDIFRKESSKNLWKFYTGEDQKFIDQVPD